MKEVLYELNSDELVSNKYCNKNKMTHTLICEPCMCTCISSLFTVNVKIVLIIHYCHSQTHQFHSPIIRSWIIIVKVPCAYHMYQLKFRLKQSFYFFMFHHIRHNSTEPKPGCYRCQYHRIHCEMDYDCRRLWIFLCQLQPIRGTR